jgi:hypothetical protein
MTVLQQISKSYFASLILGLLYGLTFCTSTHIPCIKSYSTGIGARHRKKGSITFSIFKFRSVNKISEVF